MVGTMNRRDVPWPTLRAEFAAGASLGSLGRRYGVSRQAVAKRAAREGWQRGRHAAVLGATATAQRLATPRTDADLRLRVGSRSLAGMAAVIASLERGSTLILAAKAAGVDRGTLHQWLKDDAAFQAAAEAAQARFIAQQIECIGEAGERDWRAAAWIAEKHPAAGGEFSDPTASGAAAGPGVILNLILPDALKALLPPPGRGAPVIEHRDEGAAVPSPTAHEGDEDHG